MFADALHALYKAKRGGGGSKPMILCHILGDAHPFASYSDVHEGTPILEYFGPITIYSSCKRSLVVGKCECPRSWMFDSWQDLELGIIDMSCYNRSSSGVVHDLEKP